MQSTPQFFTITNARFFCGTVALLNSLRITGHEGELVVLDTGLDEAQRQRLAPHTTLVRPGADRAGNPTMFKAFPSMLKPRGTIVIIDSDMLVTGSLARMFEAAEEGRICLYGDPTQRVRWFAEWEGLFSLSIAPRRQPYLNAGFVVFSTLRWPNLLERWWEVCWRIPDDSTRTYGAAYEDPLCLGDQDALNALLMSEIPGGAVLEAPQLEAPIFEQLTHVQVVDEERLACTHRGVSTVLLHEAGTPKVWEREACMRVRGAYVRLAPRALLADDLPLRLEPSELPPWMRGGRGGRALARGLSLTTTVVLPIIRMLPSGLRPSSEGVARLLAGARKRSRRLMESRSG